MMYDIFFYFILDIIFCYSSSSSSSYYYYFLLLSLFFLPLPLACLLTLLNFGADVEKECVVDGKERKVCRER